MEKCSYLDPGSDYTAAPASSLKYSSDLSKRSETSQIFTESPIESWLEMKIQMQSVCISMWWRVSHLMLSISTIFITISKQMTFLDPTMTTLMLPVGLGEKSKIKIKTWPLGF